MANEKHPEVTALLRGRIAGGEFSPGARLPSRMELIDQFQVSSVTLQRAMDTLVTEGFIEGRGRQGTVVVGHPPFLHHYGLLLPCQSASKQPPLRSWQVLIEVARQVLGRRPNRLSIFYQGDLQQSMSATQAFLGDIAAHRLAGLIVPALPVLHMADLIESGGNGFPLVAYHGGPFLGAATTRCDDQAAAARVLDFLQSRGRTRIGQLVPGAWYENPHYEADFLRTLPGRGMRCERHWMQVLLPQTPQGVRNAAEMLARAPDGPDAIIIHDDNAVQEAIDGIRAAGKRIPEDIELVAWGNFPWPDQYTAPVKRFGVDMMQLVSRAKDYIDARRRGERPEPVIDVDMIDEIEAKKRSKSLIGCKERSIATR